MRTKRFSDLMEMTFKSLDKLEKKELTRMRENSNALGKCKPFSGDIGKCAVLCDGMSCGDFGYKAPPIPWPGCPAMLKCKGFSGDGRGCKTFEIVGI